MEKKNHYPWGCN